MDLKIQNTEFIEPNFVRKGKTDHFSEVVLGHAVHLDAVALLRGAFEDLPRRAAWAVRLNSPVILRFLLTADSRDHESILRVSLF